MSNLTYISLYLIMGILMFLFLLKNNRRLDFVGAYSGFSFGMILYYVIIPIMSIIYQEELVERYSLVGPFMFSKSSFNFVFSIILILVSYIIFTIFYNIGSRHDLPKVNVTNHKKEINRLIVYFAYATLIVGGLSFIVLLYGLGGVGKALNIAEVNRSFSSALSDFVDYRISLLVIPARIITVSPYLFFYLIFNRQLFRDKTFFVISFILSILFFLFNAGRAPLLAFLLSFIYVFLRRKIKKTWTMIIFLGVISLPMLDLLDQLFVFFNTGQWANIKLDSIKYLYQFIHPFRNILNVRDLVDLFDFRKGIDFITTFINLIPGINFPVSYENTSFYYYGSLWTILGGIPNDVITFGYIQLGLTGVVIFSTLLGWIFGKVDRSLSSFKKGPEKDIITSAIALNCFFLVSSADIEPIIRSNFILSILIIVVLIVSKKRTKERI